jgi:hypothetical protein
MSVPHSPAGDNPGRAGILLPKHRADLHGSGLSDEQIARCGFYSLADPYKVAEVLGGWMSSKTTASLGPCLCIPFFGPGGEPLDYVRVKPNNPRKKDGKTVKYESPVGKPNQAYFPPATRAVLADPLIPLLITEGEKKAAKADQEGFPCIGLVGVYGWVEKRNVDLDGKKSGPLKLIPTLAAVEWAKRRVILGFDSDIVEKPEVRLAEWQFAEVLQAVGADVRVVRLPAESNGEKNGLDDYLHRHGAEALRRLIESATIPTAPGDEPSRSSSHRSSPRFASGDRVSPGNRGNVGTVSEVLSGNRYRVRFEEKGQTAEGVFPGTQLQPYSNPATARPGTPPKSAPPYVPFPVEALPAPLQPFVLAESAAIPCDSAAVALPALIACGAAIGAARALSIKNAWTEPPILWGVVVARSGSVKSPPLEHAVDPLVKIDLDLRRANHDAIRAHKEAEKNHKEVEREQKRQHRVKRNDGNTDGDTPEVSTDTLGPPPPKLRCVAGDVTIEALAVILEDNPKGVLVYRDELASWFNSLARYSKTDTTADWLVLFHARTLTVDRKTGDKLTVAVPNAAASIVGTIQPMVLARALTTDFRTSGGAARLLLVMPPPKQKVWTEADVSKDISDAYELLIHRLRAMEPHQGSDRTYPILVTFTEQARKRWGDFVNEWGQVTFEAGEEDDDLGAAFSKIEAYAARFALIHHLVTLAGSHPVPIAEPVGLESLEAGITLAKWFANEAERVYSILVEDDLTRRVRELAEWVRNHGGHVTIRALQKSNSRKYRRAETAEADLNHLVAAGRGSWEEHQPSTGGHPTREFVLCPTHDTSDTRPEAEEDSSETSSDTRPVGPPGTIEIPGDFGRVSEVSSVGREVERRNDPGNSEAVADPSVEPKPTTAIPSLVPGGPSDGSTVNPLCGQQDLANQIPHFPENEPVGEVSGDSGGIPGNLMPPDQPRTITGEISGGLGEESPVGDPVAGVSHHEDGVTWASDHPLASGTVVGDGENDSPLTQSPLAEEFEEGEL